MDGLRTEGLNSSVLAQLSCGVLDDETASTVAEVLMHLKVAANACKLAIENPDSARGMLRVAQAQSGAATSLLDEWRNRGSGNRPSPTTMMG